jgi:hypothetical protein
LPALPDEEAYLALFHGPRRVVSIGAQTEPRIGVQKGPLGW